MKGSKYKKDIWILLCSAIPSIDIITCTLPGEIDMGVVHSNFVSDMMIAVEFFSPKTHEAWS